MEYLFENERMINMSEKMRTRFLPKLTNAEVEKYLERNDIIFVPIGTIEAHGEFPLDVENTAPEAFAFKMAEKVDGLVLGSLPFFFCGATTIGKGTIQMSVAKGVEYLKEISYSLLNQGFRRQIYVSMHGPAFLTAGTVVIDFFDETKVPISYIDLGDAIRTAGEEIPGFQFSQLNDVFFGAYEILNRKDELLIDPTVDYPANVLNMFKPQPTDPEELKRLKKYGSGESKNVDFFSYLRKFANGSGAVGFYFSEPNDHGWGIGALPSIEVRDQAAKRGAELIEKMVETFDMPEYVKQMRALDEWTQNYIKPKYGKHLPKNKFSEWQ